MFLGFSDRDAFDRVVADLRSHFRRVGAWFSLDQCTTVTLDEGAVAPIAWLSHGGAQLSDARFAGPHPVTPMSPVGARRCLVPYVHDGLETRMLGGSWGAATDGVTPAVFRLVQTDDGFLEIGPAYWSDWLNPERNIRPMLRPTGRLMVLAP